MRLFIFLIGIIFCFWACHNNQKNVDPKQYISQAFDSIKMYSIKKHTFPFDSLEQSLLNEVTDSTDMKVVHQVLLEAVQKIDRHSYVFTKEEYITMRSGKNPEVLTKPYPFYGKILNKKYAYLSLEGFSGVDSLSSDRYCDSLQRMVVQLYRLKPAGWIIDLRFNSGGWIYPMIAGLGPILGKGVKAREYTSEGTIVEYYYAKNDDEYIKLSNEILIFEKTLPVAVLIGKQTGSAGELLALCFRGNPKTTLIGEPTFGVSTGLKGFFMPDSLQIAVTNSILADRNGMGGSDGLNPTIYTFEPTETFQKAYKWINEHE